MDPNPTTDQLESMARASLQEGFTPPPSETAAPTKEAPAKAAETPAQKQQAQSQDTPTDDSVTDETPEAEAEPAEKEQPDPKEKKVEGKPESEFLKKVKEEKRKEKTWNQINERKEQVDVKEHTLAQREQYIAQREAQFNQMIEQARQNGGKLPSYRATDGREYPADMVRNVVKTAFASGEEQQGEQAIDALINLARQAGVQESLAPTQQQFATTRQRIEIEVAKRPELAPTSGSKQAEVLNVFFKDPEFASFISRRPSGVRDAIDMADAIAKGMTLDSENRTLKQEIAQLKKQVGDKSKEVAHYEKTTAPARSGVARKPSPQKGVGELTTDQLEGKSRQIARELMGA